MAVHRAIGGRDPLSYPRLENDDNFVGKREMQKLPFTASTREVQGEQPWSRLFNTGTLSSVRHQVFSFDSKAPNDSLDFLLKTKYDQHIETLKPISRTRVQKETVDEDHGRILKNRTKIVQTPPPPLNHPLRVSVSDRKERIEQAKLAIESHHTILTNKGYSRKPDGGFFTA
ncbi:hypothetical protein BpHYR1_001686 [Brachionus plicatilis]|uniref:Uncharacterized protein n=1 Tax=Brachionus plicatilis TaxID=10195 RepID=A0A3M7SZP5_BRAPC|nr:hypothetical protein BpHYR1_001686 [Brachionus plicatilis]